MPTIETDTHKITVRYTTNHADELHTLISERQSLDIDTPWPSLTHRSRPSYLQGEVRGEERLSSRPVGGEGEGIMVQGKCQDRG
jgi:hypothetical protein